MDIEKMSNLDIDQDKVKLISDRCQELNNIRQQQKQIEEQLSEVKSKGKHLEEQVIPEMMAEAGVSKLKMKDGTEVEVKPFMLLRFLSLELRRPSAGYEAMALKT